MWQQQHPKVVVVSYFPVTAILVVNGGVAANGEERDRILTESVVELQRLEVSWEMVLNRAPVV